MDGSNELGDGGSGGAELALNEARLESLLKIINYPAADIQDFLDFALEQAIALTGSEIGYIYFYDSAERKFALNTWSKEVMAQCRVREKQGIYALDDTGIWGEAVRQRKPILINDFPAPHPLKRGMPEGHAPLRRFLTIPIFNGDDIVAVVGVANKAGPYDGSDIRQLTLMMNPVWTIAEKTRIAAELRASEEKFHKVFAGSPLGIGISRLDSSEFIDCNPAYARILGFEREEIIGRRSVDLGIWKDPGIRAQLLPKLREEGQVHLDELELLRKGGEPVSVEVDFLLMDIGGAQHSISIISDITRRKATERDLLESRAILKATIDSTTDLVWSVDSRRFGLITWNAGLEGYFRNARGIELKAGMTPDELFPPSTDFADRWRGYYRQALSEGPFTTEYEVYSGKRILLLSVNLLRKEGQVFGLSVFGKDITERKQTELVLQNSQKLESLGVLAGGIAHDFNNLLAGIYGYMGMAADKTKEPEVAACLAKARASFERARNLTQQLLTFAKGGSPVKKLDALGPFLREAALFALSGSRVKCGFALPDGLWACEFDRNQLGQVIDNIVINAQQAMPDGGSIELSAENETLSGSGAPPLPAGPYVRISVRDQGMGIAPEVRDRIFDPFFTTKPSGHGLGLATCYSIVTRHGGWIDVDSEPGKGSTFSIHLPASPGAVGQAAPAADAAGGGTGRILVMDDEEMLLDICCGMLESLGYDAIQAMDGKEAVEGLSAAARSGRKVDAAILDLTIPGGVGGKEVLADLRRAAPSLPVFVMSGYADAPIMADPEGYGFTASIRKPFRKEELAELLSRHLKG